MTELSDWPIFEVDRQVTQRIKRSRINELLGHIPANVHFVEADALKVDDLKARLIASGFDTKRKSVILAEGLISHLPEEAVNSIFSSLTDLVPIGSWLIFTYVHDDEINRPEVFRERRWRWWALLNGEPFKFGFYPERLRSYLALCGFRLVTDRSTAEAVKDYLPDTHPRYEPGCAFYHVVATVRAE